MQTSEVPCEVKRMFGPEPDILEPGIIQLEMNVFSSNLVQLETDSSELFGPV
jgi:hypothetical protein